MRRKALRIALTAAIFMIPIAATLPVGSTAASADDCADVAIIGARGSGEEAGLGETVADTANRYLNKIRSFAKVEYRAVKYPALPVLSTKLLIYKDSVNAGASSVRAEISSATLRCPNMRFALVGYSQGAQAVTQFLATINSASQLDRAIAERILGVSLFGSPVFAPRDTPELVNQSLRGPDPYNRTRQGLYRQLISVSVSQLSILSRQPWVTRSHSYCIGNDIVCQGAPGSFEAHKRYGDYYTAVNAQWLATKTKQALRRGNPRISPFVPTSISVRQLIPNATGTSLISPHAVSDDGNWVAVGSDAPQYSGDSATTVAVLVDVRRGTASTVPESDQISSNGHNEVAISGDGTTVVFPSFLPDGGPVLDELLIHDRTTGQTNRPRTEPLDGRNPALSTDGRYVLFDRDHALQYPSRLDRQTGELEFAAVNENAEPVRGDSIDISGDGSRAFFGSHANLAPEISEYYTIFEREFSTQTTSFVVNPPTNYQFGMLSENSRYFAHPNADTPDIELTDRESGLTTLVPLPSGMQMGLAAGPCFLNNAAWVNNDASQFIVRGCYHTATNSGGIWHVNTITGAVTALYSNGTIGEVSVGGNLEHVVFNAHRDDETNAVYMADIG